MKVHLVRLFLILVSLLLVACGEDSATGPEAEGPATPAGDWVIEHGMPISGEFHDVWAASADDIWAVGESEGFLAHYDGVSWRVVSPWERGPVRLNAIWGFAWNEVWAVGDDGHILHYDGNDWGFVANPLDSQLEAIWGAATDDIWVASTDGELIHWDGSTWTLDSTWQAIEFTALIGLAADDVFAFGNGGVLRRQGGVWTDVNMGTQVPVFDAWVHESGDLYTVGAWGTALRFTGASWIPMHAEGEHLGGVTGIGDRIYAVGAGGRILLFDEGEWGVMSSGTEFNLWGIVASADDELVAVGDRGTVLRGDGISWTSELGGEGYEQYAVWVNESGKAWSAGDASTILSNVDGEWEPVREGEDGTLYGIWGRSEGTLWAVGESPGGGSAIHHFDGQSWSHEFDTTRFTLGAVHGASTGPIWAVGDEGVILRLESGTWEEFDSPTTADIQDVWVAENGAVFVTGNHGVIHEWNPSDEEWRRIELGWEHRITGIHGLPDGSLFVCDQYGVVYRIAEGIWTVIGTLPGNLVDIWVLSADAVWVLGLEPNVIHAWDGVDWREEAWPGRTELLGIGGNAAGDIYAVGEGETIFSR